VRQGPPHVRCGDVQLEAVAQAPEKQQGPHGLATPEAHQGTAEHRRA